MSHLLDQPIPGEIKDDEFYWWIRRIASRRDVQTMLEIGSGSGRGSTKAFVDGIERNPNKSQCRLFCLEISKVRCEQVRALYKYKPYVQCYNYCSIPFDLYPTAESVREFYTRVATNTNAYPLETVLKWMEAEKQYIRECQIPDNGISVIIKENDIERFDVVLIDGSAFTAAAEINLVYGTTYLMLDDTYDIKNYDNCQRLKELQHYTMHKGNITLRNGFAIFKRRTDRELSPCLTNS